MTVVLYSYGFSLHLSLSLSPHPLPFILPSLSPSFPPSSLHPFLPPSLPSSLPPSLHSSPSIPRQEIQREQSRRQASEGHLQAKITQQTGEITIFKSKVTGLEDELKQTKQLSTSHAYQKLEEVRGEGDDPVLIVIKICMNITFCCVLLSSTYMYMYTCTMYVCCTYIHVHLWC